MREYNDLEPKAKQPISEREAKRVKAKELLATGLTRVKIAATLGLSVSTVETWLKSDGPKRVCGNQARYRAKNKSKAQAASLLWQNSKYGRCFEAVRAATKYAKLMGTTPPAFSATDAMKSLSCECGICNSPEVSERLLLDFDKKNGKLRGWLCRPCKVRLLVIIKAREIGPYVGKVPSSFIADADIYLSRAAS